MKDSKLDKLPFNSSPDQLPQQDSEEDPYAPYHGCIAAYGCSRDGKSDRIPPKDLAAFIDGPIRASIEDIRKNPPRHMLVGEDGRLYMNVTALERDIKRKKRKERFQKIYSSLTTFLRKYF